MKYEDLKDLSKQDLLKKKNELRHEMLSAKLKNTLGQVSNPLSVRSLRKDIARIETILALKRV